MLLRNLQGGHFYWDTVYIQQIIPWTAESVVYEPLCAKEETTASNIKHPYF